MYSSTFPGTIVKLAHFETYGNYTGHLKGQSSILSCINSTVPWLSSTVVKFIQIAATNCIDFSVLKPAWFMLGECVKTTIFANLGSDNKNWLPYQRDIAFCVFVVRLVFLSKLVDQKKLDWISQPVLCPPSVLLLVADGFSIHHLLPVSEWAPVSQDVVHCLRNMFEEQKLDHYIIVRLIVVFLSYIALDPCQFLLLNF